MAHEPAFADTSFFFALSARKDQNHSAAIASFKRLLKARRHLVTTDYILDETLTLTKMRTSAEVARALLARIERSPNIVIEPITGDRFAAAEEFFRRYADHDYSFTDCTSFILMRELRIHEALSSDQHFRKAGFRLLMRR